MKEKLILLRQDNRIYIRDIDIKRIKPQLDLCHISISTSQKGKYTGVPRHYVSITQLTKLITILSSDYEIIFR